MKKYLQISVVLVAFFLLVLVRNIRGEETPIVGKTDHNNSNSSSPQTSQPTETPSQTNSVQGSSTYKDGNYTGDVADAYYGNLQVAVTISNGKISDIQLVQYPNDNQTSLRINQEAFPTLKSEAIQAQSAQVDVVSGASQSSEAFQQSVQSALQKAQS